MNRLEYVQSLKDQGLNAEEALFKVQEFDNQNLNNNDGGGDDKKEEKKPVITDKAKKLKTSVTQISDYSWSSFDDNEKQEILDRMYVDMNKKKNPYTPFGSTLDEMGEDYFTNIVSTPTAKNKRLVDQGIIEQNQQELSRLISEPEAKSLSFYQKPLDELTDEDFNDIIKYKDYKQKKQLLKEENQLNNILNVFSGGKPSLETIDTDEYKRIEAFADKRDMDIDEAARFLGYEVDINKIDEDEDETIVPVYDIKKGTKDNISFLQNKKVVSDYIYNAANWKGKQILTNKGIDYETSGNGEFEINGVNFKVPTFESYAESEMPMKVKQGRGVVSRGSWMDTHYSSLQKKYRDKIYNSFLIQLDQKFPAQIQRRIDIAGDNILRTESAEEVVDYLNGGIPETDIKGNVAWNRIEQVKNSGTAFYVKQGDKPNYDEVGKKGGPKTMRRVGNTEGVNMQKVEDIMNFAQTFYPPPVFESDEEKKQFEATKQKQIEKIVNLYKDSPTTYIDAKMLKNPEAIKRWYSNYIEGAVDFDFKDDFSYLYNTRTNKLEYGTDEEIILKKEQLIESGADEAEIITVSSEDEKKQKIKEIRTNMLNFMPEKRQDLSGAMVQSYYNILGLQKELNQQGIKVPGYDENIKQGKITIKPELIDGGGFLVEKYNQEVLKHQILSQSYILNFDPMSIKKSGFWEGAFEAVSEKVGYEYASNDEVRQAFYEGFVSRNPDLAKDFSKKDIEEIYEKSWLNKAGSTFPDLLLIMAEFAVTRKLAGASLKKLGKLAEAFVNPKYPKLAAWTGSFVEEMAAIQIVNTAFNQDMSLLFAVTGPVGKMIDDFYKAFFSTSAKGMYRSIGKLINQAPVYITRPADGVLKIATSTSVMKIGEVPESIIASIKEGEIAPLMHIFDPEEFSILAAQLTAAKGFAPVKGVFETIDQVSRGIKARFDNKKYQAKITEYNKLIFNNETGSTKKSTDKRNKEIDQYTQIKLDQLGVNSRIQKTLNAAGFTHVEVMQSKSINDLINKAEGRLSKQDFRDFKSALEASKKAGIEISDIQEAVKVLDAQQGLKLNSEYESFLEAQKSEGFSEQTIILSQFRKAAESNTLVLDYNTVRAIKFLKSPTLVSKFLESYGVKLQADGTYKNATLNLIMDPGKPVNGQPSYPNLSFIQTQLEFASKNNVDLTSGPGRKFINNTVRILETQKSINDVKAEIQANPVNKSKLESELNSLEEQKTAYERSEETIVEEARAEQRLKAADIIDKVQKQKKQLGVDEAITVQDIDGLKTYYREKVNETNVKIEEINEKISSLKPGDPRIKEFEDLKSRYEIDKKAYKQSVLDLANTKPGELQKGKAYTSAADGTKSIVFNLKDIFRAADPTIAAHELLHPFVNTKIRELGLEQNSPQLDKFIKGFYDNLSDYNKGVVKSRLEKQGIDYENYENLSSMQKLEVFNAYAEGIVLKEITFDKNDPQVKVMLENFEAFLEGKADADVTITAENFDKFINEYVADLNRVVETGRKPDRIAMMIAQGDDRADIFEISTQSSGEKSIKLEEKLEQYKDELNNLPKGDYRIAGLQRNINVIIKLLNKTSELDKNFKIIQEVLNENTSIDEARDTPTVQRAENKIYELASRPGGTLYKLKNSFDINKLDQNYSYEDKIAIKENFEGQVDLYFSMALNSYLKKPIDQRAPFEVYLREGLGKKFTNALDASIKKQFESKFRELTNDGMMATDVSEVPTAFESPDNVIDKVEEKQESPFKFNENNINNRNKALIEIFGLKSEGKKFTGELDKSIKTYMVDGIRDQVSYVDKVNNKGEKTRVYDEAKTEKHLSDNYDLISKFIEGNSEWLRLRNYDLFYTAQRTEAGNIVRKGKDEVPQYITSMPTKADYVDFFLARGKFAPKGGQKRANIRSQRLLKYYELIGRIDVGNSLGQVSETNGYVTYVNPLGKKVSINVLTNLSNMDGINNFRKMQEMKEAGSVQSSVEVESNPKTFNEVIKDKDFLGEVNKVLVEDFDMKPSITILANDARILGKTEITVEGKTYNVEAVLETQSAAIQEVIDRKVIKDETSQTAISKTVEKSKNMSIEYGKVEKDYNISKEEANERKDIGQKAMEQNDYFGKKKDEIASLKENNPVLIYDYGTNTYYKGNLKNRNKALQTISEYTLSLDQAGSNTQFNNHLGDHSRNTGVGRVIDGEKITPISENIDISKAGSKNKYAKNLSIKDLPTLGNTALLNTFLKLDPKDLDVVTESKSSNDYKRKIKNALSKLGIDYLDPNAKQLVADIVLDPAKNAIRSQIMKAKWLGAFDMFWSVPKEQLSNVWNLWTQSTKGDSNHVNGSRALVKLTAAEINNLRLDQIWEKLEHGDAIASFNETANALVMNGKRAELIKLIDAFEGYYFNRPTLDVVDKGTTVEFEILEHGDAIGGIIEGLGETATTQFGAGTTKILSSTGNVEVATTKTDYQIQKGELTKGDIDVNTALKPISPLQALDKIIYYDPGLGKSVPFVEGFNNAFKSVQSSKEKYTEGEINYIRRKVGEEVLADNKVNKGEILRSINKNKNEIKNKKKVVVSNKTDSKKIVDTETSSSAKVEVSNNALLPEHDASNNQFLDQGNSENWNKDIKKETPEGTYTYDASNNTVTAPNNTGKFSPTKKVVLLAGGAGSGKSTTWKNIVKDHPELGKLEIINSDLDKQRLKKDLDLPENESNYDEAQRSLLSKITGIAVGEAKMLRQEKIDKGEGFVLDGTLASYRSNRKLIDQLKEQGYDVQIVYTKTDVEVASQRNANRKERSIKDGFLRRNHEQVNESMELFAKDGEVIIEFDGSQKYNKETGDASFNELNKNVKATIKPNEKVGVQSSTEHYEKESNRIVSNFAKVGEGEMSQPVSEKLSKQQKKKFRFMGFKAQQAMNLMLEIVPKGDKAALEYMEKGVDLADLGRYNFGKYSATARSQIKELNKSDKFKGIKLDKNALKIVDSEGKEVSSWTRSDVVRIYNWSKSSKNQDWLMKHGVDAKTIFEVQEYMRKDEVLKEYADTMYKIVDTDGTGWVDPYDGWVGTSLKFDINRAIDQKRATFMEPFSNWYNTTFSSANLRKIQAGMTKKDYVNWLESSNDWYERAMTNRTGAKGEKVGQRFVNWLHGSTALALFGNRKSAFTQLISTSNFFGAENNSIFQAAEAYGSKEIFEAMRYIAKHPYLKDRRGSYDLAIKEINEIESKFGDLYKKGVNLSFLLSQLGDNAAIIIGGSSMLLNNAKKFMRENPEMTKEEAYSKAMDIVALHSERTQQSTYASNLTMQQTKAIGKVTLNFLNTQIRYNNIALEEMKKIRKGVSKDINKSIMRVINYTGIQVGTFAFLSSGLQYLMMDDEENYEPGELDEMKARKKQEIILNGMTNIINGTGITGKATTTLIGMCQEVYRSATATEYQKQQAKIAEKALQMSPALSIKYRKLQDASYDIKNAIKNYKKGEGWMYQSLRAGTKIFSAATNIAAPEYGFSIMDQYRFIMDARYTFWQSFGAAMGWSLYSMDTDFYKDRKEWESTKEGMYSGPKEGTYQTDKRKYKVETTEGTYKPNRRKTGVVYKTK